jgi:CheY-like chemotaxis protein
LRCEIDSLQPKHPKLSPANSLLLTVSDNGPGISKEIQQHIFDRFFQSDDTVTRNFEGSGIGLALSKELAELYGGVITEESEVGKGAIFHINLPLEQVEWNVNQMVALPQNHSIDIYKKETPLSTVSHDAPLFLLVEDNEDLRAYLRSSLESTYKILEASNGQIGLQLAQEHSCMDCQ